jgi:hypothetical protein
MNILGLLILQVISSGQVEYSSPQEIRIREQNVTLQYEYSSSLDHCLSHLDNHVLNRNLNKFQILYSYDRTWRQWYCVIPSGLKPVRDSFNNVISVTLIEPHINYFEPEKIFSHITIYFPDDIDMSNFDRKGQEQAFGDEFNISYMKPMVFTVQYKEYVPANSVHTKPKRRWFV